MFGAILVLKINLKDCIIYLSFRYFLPVLVFSLSQILKPNFTIGHQDHWEDIEQVGVVKDSWLIPESCYVFVNKTAISHDLEVI